MERQDGSEFEDPLSLESLGIRASGIVSIGVGGFVISLPLRKCLALGFNPRSSAIGNSISSDTWDLLREEAELSSCIIAGKKLAAAREECRSSIVRKLSAKGFTSRSVEKALLELESEGFIDDERYGRLFLESLLRTKGDGPASALAKLTRRLGDLSTARALVQKTYTPETCAAALVTRATYWQKRGYRGSRLCARLGHEGFKSGEIREAGLAWNLNAGDDAISDECFDPLGNREADDQL